MKGAYFVSVTIYYWLTVSVGQKKKHGKKPEWRTGNQKQIETVNWKLMPSAEGFLNNP